MKNELVNLIGLAEVTYHKLRNILAEVEGVINNRTLTKTGNLKVITPRHNMTGRHYDQGEILTY